MESNKNPVQYNESYASSVRQKSGFSPKSSPEFNYDVFSIGHYAEKLVREVSKR